MALAGNAAVIVWNDIAPELRNEFFEWHSRQHMPERLALPGFLRGRRCIALGEGVEFLTLYEVRDLDVLDSDPYRTRLANPTAWSAKVMPGFRNNVRGGCRVVMSHGHVMGGIVQTLRVDVDGEQARAEMLAKLAGTILPELLERPRVTGVHLCVNDAARSGGQVGARQGRFITQPDIVILLEGSTAEGVARVADAALPDGLLASLGARAAIQRDIFQLEYSLQKIEGAPLAVPSTANEFEVARQASSPGDGRVNQT